MHAPRHLHLRDPGATFECMSSARGGSRAARLANLARRGANLRLRLYVFLRAARNLYPSREVAQRPELRWARRVLLLAQQHGEVERRGFLWLQP